MGVESIITANNKIIASYMGFIYECSGDSRDYHHRKRMSTDGDPSDSSETIVKSEWLMWYPHNDYNDLMEVYKKLHQDGIMYEFRNKSSSLDGTWFKTKLTYFNEAIPAGVHQIYAEKATQVDSMYSAAADFIRWYLKFNKNK